MMKFEEWLDTFMDEEEKVHFLDAGLMGFAWNAALDEAVKVAQDFHDSHGGRSNTAHIVANKISELKQ